MYIFIHDYIIKTYKVNLAIIVAFFNQVDSPGSLSIPEFSSISLLKKKK